MTGSALMDFLIAIVGLCVVGALFFLAIEKMGPDDFFKKVAKYAVGGVAIIALLFAVKAVLFGGGGGLSISPVGIVKFAVGLLVAMIVVYLIYLVVDKFAPEGIRVPIKYVVSGIALIALLVLAGEAMFGISVLGSGSGPVLRRGEPFRVDGARVAALPVRTAVYL